MRSASNLGPDAGLTKPASTSPDYTELFDSVSRLAREVSDSADRLANSGLELLVRIGERSAGARAAEAFRQLYAMTDEELAERGLTRDQLTYYCFGHLGLY